MRALTRMSSYDNVPHAARSAVQADSVPCVVRYAGGTHAGTALSPRDASMCMEAMHAHILSDHVRDLWGQVARSRVLWPAALLPAGAPPRRSRATPSPVDTSQHASAAEERPQQPTPPLEQAAVAAAKGMQTAGAGELSARGPHGMHVRMAVPTSPQGLQLRSGLAWVRLRCCPASSSPLPPAVHRAVHLKDMAERYTRNIPPPPPLPAPPPASGT